MEYIKLTEKGEERLNKLSTTLKFLVKYLIDSINSIFRGDCSEDQIIDSVGTLKQNADGKIGKEDVLNYDKAGVILGFGTTNRVGLKKFLDENGVKQIRINNMCCGFLKSEILALKKKIKS